MSIEQAQGQKPTSQVEHGTANPAQTWLKLVFDPGAQRRANKIKSFCVSTIDI